MSLVVIWLIVLVVLLIIELLTMVLTTIWFAGGAFVAMLMVLAGLSVYQQIVAFLLVSLVLLFYTRPLALNYFNGNRTRTNIDELEGKNAIVMMEINNLKGTGQVNLKGMEWSARTDEDNEIIPRGAIVRVKRIQGVKVIVEEVSMTVEETKDTNRLTENETIES